MVLPNFIGIGVPRSGTSWIHMALKQHPDVLVPRRTKEIHFFSRDSNYEQDLDWYASFFSHHDGESAVGEISPTYFSTASAAERIYKHIPQARLIVSLRNPAERAYSSYTKQILRGLIPPKMDFFEAAQVLEEKYRKRMLEQGLYHQHLCRYLSLFPKEHILVMLYDDLEEDPKGFIRQIYDFIGVDSSFVPSTIGEKINEGKYLEILRWLEKGSRTLIPSRYLYKYRNFRNRLEQRYAPRRPELPRELRFRLVEYYREEILKLEDSLERDLKAWLH